MNFKHLIIGLYLLVFILAFFLIKEKIFNSDTSSLNRQLQQSQRSIDSLNHENDSLLILIARDSVTILSLLGQNNNHVYITIDSVIAMPDSVKLGIMPGLLDRLDSLETEYLRVRPGVLPSNQ